MTEWDLPVTNFLFEKTMPGSIWRLGFDVAGKMGEKIFFFFTIYSAPGFKLFCNNHKYGTVRRCSLRYLFQKVDSHKKCLQLKKVNTHEKINTEHYEKRKQYAIN
jgi:hypothetical protein